jgi:hypothetical protein
MKTKELRVLNIRKRTCLEGFLLVGVPTCDSKENWGLFSKSAGGGFV